MAAPPDVSDNLDELDEPIEPVMGEEVPLGTTLSGEELAKEWAENAASSRRSTKIAAILLVAVVGSLATFGFLYQDLIREEAISLQAYLGGKKPQAEVKVTPPAPPAATVSMSSSNTPSAPKSPDIVVSEKEEVISPTPPVAPPATAATPAAADPPLWLQLQLWLRPRRRKDRCCRRSGLGDQIRYRYLGLAAWGF